MHADRHAGSQSNACRDRHRYIHSWQASTVSQTGRHRQTQPARQLDALMYTHIQADTGRECLYRQLHADIDLDRHAHTDVQRQTETDRDIQRHTEADRGRQRQTETARDRQRQTETDIGRHCQRETLRATQRQT